MLPTRFMDLPGWPPEAGGPNKAGATFPVGTDQVRVETVIRILEGNVMFMCRFGERSEGYTLFVPDAKTAQKFAKTLRENVGKTLLEIGFIAVPADDE